MISIRKENMFESKRKRVQESEKTIKPILLNDDAFVLQIWIAYRNNSAVWMTIWIYAKNHHLSDVGEHDGT